jgi:hypothetical protein
MTRQDQLSDRWAIRELIEGWVVWRDGGNWEQLRACWHDDGRMMATWFQGTADEFIQVCRDGFSLGMRGWHLLGGMAIELQGHRAVSADESHPCQSVRGGWRALRRGLHRPVL